MVRLNKKMEMRIVFIGTRDRILKRILGLKLPLVSSFVVEGSYAERLLSERNIKYEIIKSDTKEAIFKRIAQLDFDILVSNGCPFIIPVCEIKKKGQLFINIHPSLLPYYKGNHPVNGVILRGERYSGVTCHFINQFIDTGNIIYQEKIVLTDDIDSDLLYQLCFDLEADVFEKAFLKLKKHNFNFTGKPQKKINSIYNRKKNDRVLNFYEMKTDTIHRILRAFSSPQQGAIAFCGGDEILLFGGQKIKNAYINRKFETCKNGEILFAYSDKILIKTIDGIIKINSYSAKIRLERGLLLK